MATYTHTRNKKGETKHAVQRSCYSPIYPTSHVPTGKPGNQRPRLSELHLLELRNPFPIGTEGARAFCDRIKEERRKRDACPPPPAALGRITWDHA